MKKIILSAMIGFVLIMLANLSFATTATVNATAVRMRETASTEANIVTNLYQDDQVEILEENGEWYKVQYGEKTGYAKSQFFTKNKETQDTTNSSENQTANEPISNQPEPTSTVAQENNVGDNITISNAIKVRKVPSFLAEEKSEIPASQTVTVQAKLGNWYKITNETISGWVTNSKLKVAQESSSVPSAPEEIPQPTEPEPEPLVTPENTTPAETTVPEPPAQTTPTESTTKKTAIVIVETARVRTSASTKSNIVDVLDEDDIVTILGEEGDFYKISTDKLEGYISKSLVKEKSVTSRSSMEERTADTAKMKTDAEALVQETNSSVSQNDIISFAKQYLGYPYVLGCSSPEKGFDCSGFTRYVFGHFGYTLGTVAADQTSLGAVVERANLQTGDLLLFYNDGKTKIGHCGIFLENGDFIHSANPQRGVVIDNLNTNSYYLQRFVTARRIVE